MDPVAFEVGSDVLHGELWPARGKPKGGVVLAHGFNSSLEEFGDAPKWLAEAGYAALAFDQRGFGKSGGERGRTNVDLAVPDIAAAVAALRERLPAGMPMFLVGHSLGGAYATAAAGRHFVEVDALAIAQPVDRLFDEVLLPLRPAYHLLGWMAEKRMARGLAPGTLKYRSSSRMLYVSVDLARQHGRPDFLAKESNLGNYRAALTMSASTWAASVRVPTLVVSSPHDRVVKPAHIRKVYDAFPGEKRWLEHRGGHSCFRDLDGRVVVDAMVAWFDQHGGSGSH